MHRHACPWDFCELSGLCRRGAYKQAHGEAASTASTVSCSYRGLTSRRTVRLVPGTVQTVCKPVWRLWQDLPVGTSLSSKAPTSKACNKNWNQVVSLGSALGRKGARKHTATQIATPDLTPRGLPREGQRLSQDSPLGESAPSSRGQFSSDSSSRPALTAAGQEALL